VALPDGVWTDISGMNQITLTVPMRLWKRAFTNEQLKEYLHGKRLFLSVNPGANGTIGGMAATRASGTYSALRHDARVAKGVASMQRTKRLVFCPATQRLEEFGR
jgi:hypothetical protein